MKLPILSSHLAGMFGMAATNFNYLPSGIVSCDFCPANNFGHVSLSPHLSPLCVSKPVLHEFTSSQADKTPT